MTTAAYPAALPSFVVRFDLSDIVHAEDVDQLQRELLATQTVLGVNPSGGSASTVAIRFAQLEELVDSLAGQFDGNGQIHTSGVAGLDVDLASINSTLGSLSSGLANLANEIDSLPDFATTFQTTGADQQIEAVTSFLKTVRLLATGVISPTSTNHPLSLGPSGGLNVKGDALGFSAFDGEGGSSELKFQRDGGSTLFGGPIRSTTMLPAVGTYAIPGAAAFGAFGSVTTLSNAAVSILLPSSQRIRVVLSGEGLSSSPSLLGFITTGASANVSFNEAQAVLMGIGTCSKEIILQAVTLDGAATQITFTPVWCAPSGSSLTLAQALRRVDITAEPMI